MDVTASLRAELAPEGVLRAGINLSNFLLVRGRTDSGDPFGVAPDMARALAERALGKLGYAADEAAIIAAHVLDAALCGYEYAGLGKILGFPEHARFKLPRQALRILHETPISALYDGGNQSGMLAVERVAQAAIDKAAVTGIAVVGVANMWGAGRAAHYVEKIARAGLIGVQLSASNRAVAPPGGAKAAVPDLAWRGQDVDRTGKNGPPVTVQFDLLRDGKASNIRLMRRSGIPSLDLSVQTAVESATYPPLPAEYDQSSATVTFTFELKR